MYLYTDFDQQLINERVAQFRDQTERYLAGKLTEDEYRPLRLQNGLYVQRYAPMLRVAVLGGYDANEFGELHRYVLVVAQNTMVAKQKGKAYFAQHWQKQHTDRVLDVDDCIAIDHVHGRYVELVSGEFQPNHWENTYITIA